MNRINHHDAREPAGGLSYTLTLPVLGVPLSFRTAHAPLLEHVERRLGHWSACVPEGDRCVPATVDLVVQGAFEDVGVAPDPCRTVYRFHDGVFVSALDQTLLTVHRGHRQGTAFIHPSLLQWPAFLGSHVIDCVALLLATGAERIPVHAAALVKGTTAVLLIGDSGAGKSTLSYAGLKAGFGLLSEDSIYVQPAAEPVVWGNPRDLHLCADTSALFPELEAFAVETLPNGKRKRTCPLAALNAKPVLRAEKFVICLLERQSQGTDNVLTPVSSETIRRRVMQVNDQPGFDLDGEASQIAATQLSANGGYRLRMGGDPSSAARLLWDSIDD